MKTTMKHHPLAAFLCLAYAFSWWPWPLYMRGWSPAPIIGFGPFLAAVAVLGVTGGPPAITELLRQMTRWRVAARWYAMALGLPLLVGGLAAGFNVWLGASAPSAEELARWPAMGQAFLLLLLIPGLGGTWEEPGWRGYALPKLTRGRSQLAAGLLLALIITGWHLPLFLSGVIPWVDLLFILGTVAIFNWVYSRADHSVFILMIFHAMNNAAGQFFPSLFSGSEAERLALVRGQLYLLGALVVLLSRWRFWIGREARRQTVGVPTALEQTVETMRG